MRCKEKYWNFFAIKIFLIILFLSFITGYPLAYISYGIGAKYQPVSFNVLFGAVYGFIMTILFILIEYYAQIKIIIGDDRIIIKSIFRAQNIRFKSTKEVHLIKYEREGIVKRMGVNFILDNGSEIYGGTTANTDMINCIIKKVREKNIPVSVKIRAK